MKLASYEIPQGGRSFGIVRGEDIVDLRARTSLNDLRALLEAGTDTARRYEQETADYRLGDVRLLPPIVNPEHIFGIGLNTRTHLKEASEYFKTELQPPAHPNLFLRSPSSHVGQGGQLVIPRVSGTLDYEGEIALVIGKGGRYIPGTDAMSHVAGIACYNDGSVREFQRHSHQVTPGKNFVASGSFGPWLVTLDEAGPLDKLVLETRVNGELRQRLEMPDLIFGFAQLIAYVSQPFHLQPGDIIITGSPAGIGSIQGKYLKAGDVVEVSVPTVGVLRNGVVLEA